MNYERMTIPFTPETADKLRAIASTLDISVARLLSCLIELDQDTIKKAIDENFDKLFGAEARAERRRKNRIERVVNSLSPEELETLMKLKSQ